MRLLVLNPNGRDDFVDYANGPGAFEEGVHPPVNYHAYAAATGGAFHRSVSTILSGDANADAPVLVLIRRRIGVSLAAARRLKEAGRQVLVAWKESGPHQVSSQLARPRARAQYDELLATADGVVSPTRILPPLPKSTDAAPPAEFIPTPYPIELESWDYSLPQRDRRGILVGTRQFKVPSRHHESAIESAAALAAQTDSFFTVIVSEGWSGRRRLARLVRRIGGERLRVVARELPYAAYLKLMASHRLVLQRDRSGVPGQVAGDALLCRTICAGGDGAIDEIAFPELAGGGPGADAGDRETLVRLMADDGAYAAAVADSQALAADRIGYRAVASRLAGFCAKAARSAG